MITVSIEQTAVMSATTGRFGRYDNGAQRSAVIVIEDVRWESPLPNNAGEAETFNRQAQELCYAFSK